MTATFRPGKRDGVQLIFGVAGASGSGKSYSLLIVAVGLAYPEAYNAEELNAIIEREGRNRIAFIDTERGRALHYAPPPGEKPDPWRKEGGWFPFDHAMMEPPFRPGNYTDLVEAADKAGYAVIIVDSGSHEWSGEGGVLEWHEEEQYAAAKRRANRDDRGGSREPGWADLEAVKMTAWIKPKMAHKKMVGKLTTLRAHLLIGLRAEQKVQFVQEYDASGNKKGKEKIVAAKDLPPVERWFPVCEKSFPYELTLSFILVPDEPGVPHPVKLQDQHRPYVALNKPLSDETGRQLAGWAKGAKVGAGEGQRPALPSPPPPSPPPPPPPAASGSPSRTAGGGRQRSPDEMTQDYIAGLAPPPRGGVKTLEDLEAYQSRAARFLDTLAERYPVLHTKASDAYDERRDQFNIRDGEDGAPSAESLFPE